MLAYHNDETIKAKYIARVRAHRAADELIQGTGWEDGKGCAVGCTLDGYDHARYPIELGIPLQLAHLEDRLFELQGKADALAWPERFLAAIRPGADLARVWPEWAVWMLVDPDHGVIRHAGKRDDVRAAIQRVADLWRTGGTPEEFRRARSAAAAYAYAADASASAYAYAADASASAYASAYASTSAAAAAAAAASASASASASAYASAYAAAYAYAACAAAAACAAYAACAADAAWRAARAAWTKAACDKLIALLEAA